MTIRERIETMEAETLSPYAALSVHTKGRERDEEPCDIRPVFQRDRDRILHCKAFRRLFRGKTSVQACPQGFPHLRKAHMPPFHTSSPIPLPYFSDVQSAGRLRFVLLFHIYEDTPQKIPHA